MCRFGGLLSMSMNHKTYDRQSQSGFTLIELLISVTLGLLISAAATKMLSNGISVYRLQAAVGDLQETAIFGLDYMSDQVSLANLGNQTVVDDIQMGSGIILSGSDVDAQNADNQVGNMRGTNVADTLLTLDAVNISNVKNTLSDQLVIQYRAPFDLTDCQGGSVSGPKIVNGELKDGDMVVQRFFLKVDPRKKAGIPDKQALVLACDAGRYKPAEDPNKVVAENSIALTGYGDAGDLLMRSVEHMRVRLGVRQQTDQKLKYLSIKQYKALAGAKPPIVAVQIAVLARANDSVGKNFVPEQQTYKMFDQTVEVDDTSAAYVRRVYTTTVMLRNGRNA